MLDRDYVCYELLMKVFRDNAYASIELNTALATVASADKAYVTRLFYGVLERSVYYDYVLGKFAKEKPKKPIVVLIKMGYYLLENSSVPAYATVNNIVALCKKAGKGGASGFVNSALRNFGSVALPLEGTTEYLSVRYSYPLWLCQMLCDEYGYDFTQRELAADAEKRTHIRVNTGVISLEDFTEKYRGKELDPSGVGYYVARNTVSELDAEDYVVQSAASVIAAKAYVAGLPLVENILDVCAAPGGKSVLLSSLTNAKVTACDLHPHRVDLIRKYASHCRADIQAVLQDATVFRPEWENKFDLVVCDVPCSGIGVAGSKPDILYNRAADDIEDLVTVQAKILRNASRYVRAGGRLCYSTCTVLRRENGAQIEAFLSEDKDFVRTPILSPLDGKRYDEIKLFRHLHHTDGFYVAALSKKCAEAE